MSAPAAWTSRLGGVGVWLEAPAAGSRPVGSALLDRAAAMAVAADGAAVAALWVTEAPGPAGSATPYEAYSLLGALAVLSDRVHLGVVADGAERRAPSILAKIVTGVDVISHGRGILALDGDCASDADAERLTEALIVCRAVLEDEDPTYAGRIYAVDGAVNRPAPVQSGGVPVVVFLHGDGPGRPALLDVAARLADAVVVDGPDEVREACRTVAARVDAGGGPGRRTEVLGRIRAGVPASAGTGSVAAVRSVRAAGADGCLVGLPFPWEPGAVDALSTSW